MLPTIEHILHKARPKIRSILKLRHLFSKEQLIGYYKTHIWGFSEYSNGAIILATGTQLDRLDRMQRWFLHELELSDLEAFLEYNFAPPTLRRRIGLLGFMHKRVLGLCHPALQELLPMCQDGPSGLPYLHDRQLKTKLEDVRCHNRMYWRSLWSYTHIYNRLPQCLVNEDSVVVFQARLTQCVRLRASNGDLSWRDLYGDCSDILSFFHRG